MGEDLTFFLHTNSKAAGILASFILNTSLMISSHPSLDDAQPITSVNKTIETLFFNM